MHDYKIGDVFRTEKKYSADPSNSILESKPRWFVYLGRASVFDEEIDIYICTATTQLKRYENINKTKLVYFQSSSSLFEKDCLLYLDDIETRFTKEKFEEYSPVFKGNIGTDKLHEIIMKLPDTNIPMKIKRDIIESFRLAGLPTS